MVDKLASLSKEFAYLDPGSGSFLLQIIIASVLGALFVAKSYWKKFSGFFRKPPSDKTPYKDDQQ